MHTSKIYMFSNCSIEISMHISFTVYVMNCGLKQLEVKNYIFGNINDAWSAMVSSIGCCMFYYK